MSVKKNNDRYDTEDVVDDEIVMQGLPPSQSKPHDE